MVKWKYILGEEALPHAADSADSHAPRIELRTEWLKTPGRNGRFSIVPIFLTFCGQGRGMSGADHTFQLYKEVIHMSTVFITGGSRGIGAAIARTFAFKGWNIAFSYLHSEEAAQALQNELSARGISVLAIRADAADPAQAAAFIERAVQELGAPDALVCSAGVALPQDVLTHVSDEDWRRVFSVNVDGLFYTVRAALPYFIRRRKGAIVTMSSMWGQIGGSCEVAYSASKGAVIAFTKALAKEVGPSNIRVNCVAPGVIDTDMNAHLSAEDMQALAEETPLGRIGTPYEVARCVRYLCSDGAEFITGQVIAPNGGIC